jgi:hypothetical protein
VLVIRLVSMVLTPKHYVTVQLILNESEREKASNLAELVNVWLQLSTRRHITVLSLTCPAEHWLVRYE